METLDIVKAAVAALEDKKAEDVTVIDIAGVSSIADYFIIANGSNQNQLTAMQDAVDEALYKAGLHAKQIEGNSQSTWILMDYQDIIVHLFSKEDRLFYDLERIWRDGKIVELSFYIFKEKTVRKFSDCLFISEIISLYLIYGNKRNTPNTLPRILQSGTMIGSIKSFSGCRRI